MLRPPFFYYLFLARLLHLAQNANEIVRCRGVVIILNEIIQVKASSLFI